MELRTLGLCLLGAATVAALAACGGGSSPSTPSTPTPTAQPTPTPTPGNTLPPGKTCSPTPPPLHYMVVKIHDDSGSRKVLDSKPKVRNVDGYCARVGTGGETQTFCDTRLEGDPQRAACDYLATGRSSITGRWGPTWYWNDQPCTDATFESCANHQDNQFLAIAKTTGKYEACASSDVPIAPDGQLCGGVTIK